MHNMYLLIMSEFWKSDFLVIFNEYNIDDLHET